MRKNQNIETDKRRWLILQCRYYNGEDWVPAEFVKTDYLYWDYERFWVEMNLDPIIEENMKETVKCFKLQIAPHDLTPITLKGVLFERFLHWGGNELRIEYEIEAFERNMYSDYIKRKTNKERRTEYRTAELIKKCRFYRGQDYCPFSVQILATYWTWEKEWVEKIADSYYNRSVFIAQMDKLPNIGPELVPILDIIAKDYSMPRTLIAYFAIKFCENISGGFVHEYATYFEDFLKKYAKK